MKYFILTILAMVGLTNSSCTTQTNQSLFKALSQPTLVSTTPPEGPYNYQKGWKDGCESGIASTNHFFQLTTGAYQFTLDEHLRNEKLYNQAWKYGFNHCGYSMRSVARYHF